MKRFGLLLLLATSPALFSQTVVSVAISPQGAAVQSGSTQQFSVVCGYSDNTTDDCAKAGGPAWSSSLTSAMTVNSSGLATWVTDPGAGYLIAGYVVVSAGGISDRAAIYGQHPGDTWYMYITPDMHEYENQMNGALIPMNVTVGATVALGEGIVINGSGPGATGSPFQPSCTWSTSNAAVATINRIGDVTAVAPGSVTLTCGQAGNAVFGSSTTSGWISPGNVITLNVVAGGTGSNTWYVRPDGGTLYSATNTSGQCSGLANAPMTNSSATNQPCAAGNLRYLWADGITYQQMQWVIAGGDTVIVAPSSSGYNIGADSPASVNQYNPTNCAGGYSNCYMPTIPSGTAAQHTRILGANYANCHSDTQKTRLIESYGAYMGINVSDSQYVDVACLEVTDTAPCANNGNYTNSCTSTTDSGGSGLLQSALTSNVTYTDIFIHGIGSDGIHGATGVGVTANYVHIRGVPSAGIDMDDAPWETGNISVAGGFTMTNSLTEFVGCVEEYPIVHAFPYIECRDQNTGAYGDGFGTASTSGDWYFDHDTWQYNYQDGLDLLHSGMNSLTVTDSLSQGNEGQAYKIGSGNTILFRNNLALTNCNRLGYVMGDEPTSSVAPGQSGGGYGLCRAGGDGIVFNFTNQGTYTVQDNTLVGYSATPFDLECEGGWDFCPNATTLFENNVVVGVSDSLYMSGNLPGLFYNGNASMPANGGWGTRDHNDYYNLRPGYIPNPLLTGEISADPLFQNEPPLSITAESQLDNFNFHPSTSSPLVGAGISISGLLTDHDGQPRLNPPSMGGLEVDAGSSLTVSQTTLTVTPTIASLGQLVTLSATVTTSGGITPTGTITFANGSTTLGTASLNSSGTASFATSALAVGSYNVTASYSGDSNYALGSSVAVPLAVNALATTTTLTASASQPLAGQSVILTAAAFASSGGATPTGTITFYNGATVLGSAPANNSGIATLSTTFASAGTYNLTAQYGGDGDHLVSVSSTFSISVNVAANLVATNISLTTPVPTLLPGSQTLLMALVHPNYGFGTPTGVVTFFNGTTQLGTASVNIYGMANLTVSNLAAGLYSLTAQYSGDSNFAASVSSATSLNVAWINAVVSGSALTIPAGNSGWASLTLSSLGGYSGPLQISCSNLPQGTTCSFQPQTITLGASGAGVTVKGIFQTTGPSTQAKLQPLHPLSAPDPLSMVPAAVLWFPGWFTAAVASCKRKLPKNSRRLLLLAMLICALLPLTACGGGAASTVSAPVTTTPPSGATPSAASSTPPGTSQVQVVLTGSGNLVQTMNLSMTVQ